MWSVSTQIGSVTKPKTKPKLQPLLQAPPWPISSPSTPRIRVLPPRPSPRFSPSMATTTATSTRRRPKRGLRASDSHFSQTLTACTRSGDAAGAMAAFDSAAAAASSTPFLAAHQYNQLLHLLSTSPSPTSAAAARRVFSHMLAAGAAPSEATITSMARIAAAAADENPNGGDEAFELVRTMKEKYGLVPRLRTYGPVLAAFRRGGEAEKAYAVEAHMAASGVAPEEPELVALLEVSATVGNARKVYEYMHKLRRVVDCVSGETAEVLESWFGSEKAATTGQASWDGCRVKEAILGNGGGCHGLGWLGSGQWTVHQVNVGLDGKCGGCGCRLACVDIARDEMQRFADCVAGLAFEREIKVNFSRFQEWLETHKRYEAIIDGANIALYQQNFAAGGFSLSQLDAVVRELQKRNKGEWPLIVLHNKRTAKLMENPSNRQLLETWRANGALYTSPNGSNDDWYWLYAAIRLNCLLVTNDEMRDHIFELLGTSFFPKWKQRHQVKYTFNKGKLELVMPPPYSSEIQESEAGSWHVPMGEKSGDERLRTWLCISRAGSCKGPHEASVAGGPIQKLAPSFEMPNGAHQEPSEDKAGCVTGKRKDRD